VEQAAQQVERLLAVLVGRVGVSFAVGFLVVPAVGRNPPDDRALAADRSANSQ
jgi:hypothetical protein